MHKEEIQEKWESMIPRERDELVTKEVMGYEYFIDSHDCVYARRDFIESGFVFQPSTDVSSAWKVVDEMSERGYPMSLDNNDYRGHYSAVFYVDDVTLIEASGETAPEAICKTAFLALIEVSQRRNEDEE